MGAGRKTETFSGSGCNRRPGVSDKVGNTSAAARNLRKSDLAAVIFGCKHSTISECLANQLFGLPGPHITYVRNIEPGLPLFLFNYSDRKLHGVYEAASHGQMNIDPYGWSNNGKERTPYPAQVRIYIKKYCQPLPEALFKSVISDNYFIPQHFYFELDHKQLQGLLSLFTPTQTPERNFLPDGASKGRNLFIRLPTARVKRSLSPDAMFPGPPGESSTVRGRNPKVAFCLKENKYSPLLSDEIANDMGNQHRASSSISSEDGGIEDPVSSGKKLVNGDALVVSSCGGQDVVGERETFQTEPLNNGDQATKIFEERVLNKLKKLAHERNSSNQLSKDSADDDCAPSTSTISTGNEKQIPEVSLTSFENMSTCDQLPNNDVSMQMMKELLERTKILEKKQVESEEELQQLRNFAQESSRKIEQLRVCVKELERRLDPSALFAGDLNESLVDFYLGPENLVFLIGGFDGNSWLSALDSYSPSLDLMTPLHPMSSARSYASATALDGCVYVFGGGDGTSWYDTVECYNPRNDDWMFCPPLVKEKGSLAGATLTGKIFAIGGGNGLDSFSDVEMFDPALGKWINNQSMLCKRFALTAAELNGALYAIGGFDGEVYLRSAERFDPREGMWRKVPSMNSPRGCHSVAVLNGKLYSIGGYDGDSMVSSVEMFDPRASSWVMTENMNMVRGYAAASVLGDSLFVIGGVKDGQNIVDTVECYREGTGWTVSTLKAIGQRCFFSAIVL